jgi:hypothetical protein
MVQSDYPHILANYILNPHFNHGNGGCMFLKNVSNASQFHKTQHSKLE